MSVLKNDDMLINDYIMRCRAKYDVQHSNKYYLFISSQFPQCAVIIIVYISRVKRRNYYYNVNYIVFT